MKKFFYIIALLITYGSLYPLNFSIPSPGAWEELFLTWRWSPSLGDVLGNIVLFFPLGVAGIILILSGVNLVRNFTGLILITCIFASILQLIQVWLPTRTAAFSDVVWNLAGTVLGMIAGYILVNYVRRSANFSNPMAIIPLVVLILFLLTELLPLVPSLDWQNFKDSLKPLFIDNNFSIMVVMLHAVGIMVAGLIFVNLGVQPIAWLTGTLVLILFGKLVIVNLVLDSMNLAGLLLGYFVFVILWYFGKLKQFDVVFWVLLTFWSLNAIMPFHLTSGGVFNGIPFATMLKGSLENNIQGLVHSLFVYSALIWLTYKISSNVWGVVIGLAIWVSLLELVQMFLLGRTADITEPILLLSVGWLFSEIGRYAQNIHTQHIPEPEAARYKPEPARHISIRASVETHLDRFQNRWWVNSSVTSLCVAGILWCILHMPGIPYNLRELFHGDSHFVFLFIFALAMLWIGIGAVWVSKKFVSSRVPYLSLPFWVLVVSLVSLILLSASVSQESITDISGSNNLYWFVVNKDIWGEVWKDIFVSIGPSIISIIEQPIRYTALYSILLITLAFILSITHLYNEHKLIVSKFLLLVASMLPWFWLAKAISFDWSSTDNLNELIARDGAMGLGGGGYLYLLLGLLSVNAVIFSNSWQRVINFIGATVFSLAMLPLGWWLLNLGLEANVEKYGLFFSGAQFLLGPDRSQLLPEWELFSRWSILQIGFVGIVGVGIKSGGQLKLFDRDMKRPLRN